MRILTALGRGPELWLWTFLPTPSVIIKGVGARVLPNAADLTVAAHKSLLQMVYGPRQNNVRPLSIQLVNVQSFTYETHE